LTPTRCRELLEDSAKVQQETLVDDVLLFEPLHKPQRQANIQSRPPGIG